VPAAELVQRGRAAAPGAQVLDGVDNDGDDAHEALSLLDELWMTYQLVSPGVVKRKHSLDGRPVLEDTQEHLYKQYFH